jgi:hypothetical protein
MSLHIEIFIPYDNPLTEKIRSFSEQEKHLMLKIGTECILNSQLNYSKMTEKDVTEKIREETNKEIKNIELELRIEKEMSAKMEEKLYAIYEKEKDRCKNDFENQNNKLKLLLDENKEKITQLELELKLVNEKNKIKEQEKINSYELIINTLNEKLKTYDSNIEDIIKNRMNAELNNYKLTINEKINQINMIRETYNNQENNYKREIEQLNKMLDMHKNLNNIEFNNKLLSEKEKYNQLIDNEKNKYILLLDDKQKNIEKITKNYEEILILNNKSTSHKGLEGEKKFETYADTFKDFKGFQIKDKHTQSGEGDFHLQFDEFSVLVDAKNYKKKVPIEQREKIKNDLIKNQHINFGWLVSLNTSIDKFDRAPIMYEWINTKQCLVHVNNLLGYDDPSKILRIIWFTCKELYKLVGDINVDEEELVKMKEQRFVLFDKMKCLRKSIREINTTLNTTKNMIQVMDDQLKELLDLETSQIVDSAFSLFDDWWSQNIREVSDDIITSSTDIWHIFKQDNKDIVKEFDITTDKFKQYIKTKVSLQNIVIKNKNANSAIDIKGIQLKEKKQITKKYK